MNPTRLDPLLALRLAQARPQPTGAPPVTTRSDAPVPTPTPPPPEPPYEVFIRTRRPLTADELSLLRSFIGADAPAGRNTYTATISRDAIESLSDLDWTFRISGSQTLNPLDPSAGG
jgi:hypothetical protein